MPSWPTRKSEVVGGGQATSRSLFRALVPLRCTWCAAPIAVGELFVRRSNRTQRADVARSQALQIVCQSCGAQGRGPRAQAREGTTGEETPCDNALL
jgi:RNase P subunit RPR2